MKEIISSNALKIMASSGSALKFDGEPQPTLFDDQTKEATTSTNGKHHSLSCIFSKELMLHSLISRDSLTEDCHSVQNTRIFKVRAYPINLSYISYIHR